MIPVWYIPSWHGDLRLEAVGSSMTRIKLHDPTPSEREVADVVLERACKLGWVLSATAPNHFRSGKDIAVLKAPLGEVGPMVTSIVRPDAAVLTAITFMSGRVITVENAKADLGAVVRRIEAETREVMERVAAEEQRAIEAASAPPAATAPAPPGPLVTETTTEALGHPYRDPAPVAVVVERSTPQAPEKHPLYPLLGAEVTTAPPPAPAPLAAPEKRSEALANVTPKAVVTVRRPTPCCPQCTVGAVEPASEVLLAFLDEQQHKDWAKRRAIVVRGGLTGHRYVLAHRSTELAARIGRICFDMEDGLVIHFHDRSVPPEEEVLAAKLILEHREPWLRNEATTFGGHKVFKNPFGNGGDGVWDATLTQSIGTFVSALGDIEGDNCDWMVLEYATKGLLNSPMR
jgi:hypothetical protein